MDNKVAADNFSFRVTDAAGTTRDFQTLEALESGGYTLSGEAGWDGAPAGEQSAANYPVLQDYVFDGLTVDGMDIHGLGLVEAGGSDYIYISAQENGETGPMTSIVLPEGETIRVNYRPREYPIAYEVYVDEEKQDAGHEKFGLDAVFGLSRADTTSRQSYSVKVTIPAGCTGRVYLGDASDFSASDLKDLEHFPLENGYGKYPLGEDVEWEKTDYGAKIKTDSETAPGFFSLSGTYSSGAAGTAQAPQICRVVLHQRKAEENKFDADMWVKSEDVTRPGEGKSRIESSKVASSDNTDGSRNFTWTFTTSNVFFSSFFEVRALSVNGIDLNMPFIINRYTWANASAETKLPSGVVVKVTVKGNQFYPDKRDYTVEVRNANRDMVVTAGDINNIDTSYREVAVSRRYGVDLQIWYTEVNKKDSTFAWRDVRQSASLRVGDNVQSSEDNVFNFDYAKFGTSEDGKYQGNIRFRLRPGYGWAGGSVYGSGETVQFRDKMRAWTQSFGANKTAIEGPDTDGWYYTKLSSQGSVGLLTVQAQPIQYQIRYQDGVSSGGALNPALSDPELDGVTVTGMPTFLAAASGDAITENNTDTNRGGYYSLIAPDNYSDGLGSDRVTVPGTVPTAVLRQGGYVRSASFAGWVVTDADGHAYKWNGSGYERNDQGQLEITENPAEFHILSAAETTALSTLEAAAQAVGTNSRDNVICLTACWTVPTPSFSYHVTFNYTDAGGEKHLYAQSGVDAGTEDDDVYLVKDGDKFPAVARRDTFFQSGRDGASVVFHDGRSEAVEGWLDSHPWQKFDTAQNGSEGFENQFFWENIGDGGEVDIWFTTSLGRLTVAKKVAGLDDEFTFEITFTLPTADDPDTAGDETKFFGGGAPYSVPYAGEGGKEDGQMELAYDGAGYTGTFTLRNGQSVLFDVPAGTKYTVTEGQIEGYSTTVTCKDGTTDSEGEDPAWTGIVEKPAAPGPIVTFVNTGDRLVVRKIVHHYYCAPTEESVEAAGGDPVSYTVQIKNPMATAAGPVTVTDVVPEGLAVDLSSIDNDGVWTEADHTITWTLDDLPACSFVELTFGAELPIVEETKTFDNAVTVSYGKGETVSSNTVRVTAHPYWLRVAKVVEGSGGDRTKDFTFRIDLTVPEGKTLQQSYPYAYDTGDDLTVHRAVVKPGSAGSRSGTLELQLHHGESVMIYELPEGTEYRVTETGAEGYETSLLMGSFTGKISNERDEVLVQNLKRASNPGVDHWLDAKNHDAYLRGYPDGRFGPDDPMTRAEAAQMFYNLLLNKNAAGGRTFSDVEEDSWYAPAVDALSALGIITGYDDGRFGPYDTLSRAQLVAMAMRFSKGEEGSCEFTDVPVTHWAYRYIAGAVGYGWIRGYPDGRFGPEDPLTRAQATAIVNRMLGRTADLDFIGRGPYGLKTFPDLTPEHWAYGDVLEAANGHRYAIRFDAEKWAGLW